MQGNKSASLMTSSEAHFLVGFCNQEQMHPQWLLNMESFLPGQCFIVTCCASLEANYWLEPIVPLDQYWIQAMASSFGRNPYIIYQFKWPLPLEWVLSLALPYLVFLHDWFKLFNCLRSQVRKSLSWVIRILSIWKNQLPIHIIEFLCGIIAANCLYPAYQVSPNS